MTNDQLPDLLDRLAEDTALLLDNEEATKQGVILPILSRLGWDRDNVREVVPEYRIENGRVDYCLQVNRKNVAFIEAKRSAHDLDTHQEQLLDYAFREGVELAVLTNGLEWWLYLPLLEGSWEQRKFFTIDITQQEPETATERFRDYLQKEALASGEAIDRAKDVHHSRRKERRTAETLPEAWRQLCEEPDELLVDLLAEKVESLCGHQPEPDQTAEFLEAVTAESPPKPPTTEVGPSDPKEGRRKTPGPEAGNYTGTSVHSFTLFGESHPVSSFKELLVVVCEKVADRHPDDFHQVLQLTGRKRDYFSREYEDMKRPEKIPGTDIYVETNLSANDCVKRCRQVLSLFGHEKDALTVVTE